MATGVACAMAIPVGLALGHAGKGELLAGRLLTYDALEMRFREVPLSRNPRCPLCGEAPTITELRDEVDAMTVCDLEARG